MDIKVSGHSGCIVEVHNVGTELRLIKKTREVEYVDRLLKQADKQNKYSRNKYESIKIPRILDIERDAIHCCIEMEYVYSKNFVDFFETSDVYQIDSFVQSICSFVDSLIVDSPIQSVSLERLLYKFNDVKGKILANSLCKEDQEIFRILDRSENIFASCFAINIPVGYCHGDLTLSNILFNGYSYYLIDFLDSFIETPLMDIVKLRQDTAYNWSVRMFNGDYAEARLKLIMARIDKKIHEYYSQYIWYKDFYGIFQLMNFLRILQYASEYETIEYLKKSLKTILDDEF